MKALIVCTYRSYAGHTDYVAPFVYEQVGSLKKEGGIQIEYYRIKGGVKGYLKTIRGINQMIKAFQPDIVHAHGGLCGFIATLQSKCPVVTTYHGSDINNLWTRYISYLAILRSKCNVFVSERLKNKVGWLRGKYAIVPCGVDTSIFYPMDKSEARQRLGWDADKIYILFSKRFDVKVKNYPLAKAAIELLPGAELVELKGYTREQVAMLMNASDVALMTSFSEGSPQFIKEALACACPIVSTDVGDVSEVLSGVDNCVICDYDRETIAYALRSIAHKQVRIKNNGKIKLYDNKKITKQLVELYNKIVK